MELVKWISLNKLNAEIQRNVCTIGEKNYLILYRDSDEILFDEDFELILKPEESSILDNDESLYVLFLFGSNWYYCKPDKVELNVFKYIDLEKTDLDIPFPYLGVHGEYDLCNGSRTYKEWCQKAKFLNTLSLGICETNTLAGTLAFQMACKDAGIKSILGETITVSVDLEKTETYQIKLYVKDESGWRNLLNINSQIRVFNDNFVTEDFLFKHSAGLICVLSSLINDKKIARYKEEFNDGGDLYFQIDLVEWDSQDKEKEHLSNLSNYFRSYIDRIKPILISDSFYLDREHGYIKKNLNSIGKVGFQNQSKDQFFKPLETIYSQIQELSPSDEWLDSLFFQALENTLELADKCDFKITLGELYLPQYEMTDVEKSEFESNEDLFYSLIERGIDRIRDKMVKDESVYLERVEREADLISRGGFIDYFLITYDILNWCRNQNILTPIGRGSAAGSLVSYLLQITKLDPLKYDLLFERFLSEARILSSMPDIDNDIPSDGRDDVKKYMETRYGIDYVMSIGTYGTFKIRSGITDLCRENFFDLKQTKYITSIIDDNASFVDFFRVANKTPVIKNFIQENPRIVESYPLIRDQVKNASVHAAGVIIVPKVYKGEPMTMYDWLPVKKVDDLLVTEWEGPQLEKAGYLKTDILGVKQLQKISDILKLISINKKIDIQFEDIALDDQLVFDLFRDGNNEDVFQLGAIGLKGYCKELKPDNIDDLIATLALYRPGPMESGAHKSYVKIKNGEKLPEYDFMLEGVTKNTFGLYVFQEQIMQAVQVLGGFSLAEAEEVRSAMGKKNFEKMEKYKIQFLEYATNENKCDKYEAIKIWNKLEVFAGYAFNKAHSASYAHVGYFCQWLKAHYPLEFWSIALNYSSQDEIARRIAEMHKVSSVKVLPPDINQSTNIFEADVDENVIFWSIGSIKFIGEAALGAIMKERSEKGKFFSFDDFYTRIEKRAVNKRCVVNLILSGCFDKVEKILTPAARITLLKKFLDGVLPEEFQDTSVNWKDYFWILKQKELTGFGYLEFDKIYKSTIFPKLNNNSKLRFVDGLSFQDENVTGDKKCVVGTLSEVMERKMRNKPGSFAEVVLNCNDENVSCLIWSEIWPQYKELINSSKNKIICITGKIVYDDKYKKANVLQTTDQTQIEIL